MCELLKGGHFDREVMVLCARWYWCQPPFDYPRVPLKSKSLEGVRIGYWRTPPCGNVDAEVGRACDKFVESFSRSGSLVEPLVLPDNHLLSTLNVLWLSGAAKRLRAAPVDRRELAGPGLVKAAAARQGHSAMDYVDAQTVRAEFGGWTGQVFNHLDGVVSPAASIPAFAEGYDVPPGSGQTLWTDSAGFSFPINLGQQPAYVAPCGLTEDGRPIGSQIVLPRGADDLVLEFAFSSEVIAGDI
jgi:amidase/aspartyl-tRNA(Asn)/glutamyl-tRNA(Gln) amidotransferase subunit A